MKLIKILIFIFLSLFLFYFFSANTKVFAQGLSDHQKQITIVNPIRGKDFWSNDFPVLDTTRKQYEVIKKHNLAATWLVRFDALEDKETVNFLKNLEPNQELGIFLEVTPAFTKKAGVKYNQSPNWHWAKSVLVIGYAPEDRKKMVDAVFERFKDVFGFYPKSVGAWWIDGGTLFYMKEKYGIEVNMDVADQFSTDQYQVWGQYWSVPFYPSKANALMPAQTNEQKIGVVTIQWANRDPFNGYGNGIFESTFSVQANDYVLHELKTAYFKKLVEIYPQITVGLENDFSWEKFGGEYENQIGFIAAEKQKGNLAASTMSQYGRFYKNLFPELSPMETILADDPLGGGGKVLWLLSPKYRAGLFSGNGGVAIRDLRVYNGASEESCLRKSCETLSLSESFVNSIDEAFYQSRWLLDEGRVSDFVLKQTGEMVEISYKNQAGVQKKVKFLPNDIEANGRIQTLQSAILNTLEEQKAEKAKSEAGLNPDYAKVFSELPFNTLKFFIFLILFIFLPGWALTKKWLLSIPVGISLLAVTGFLIGQFFSLKLLWVLPLIVVIYIVKSGLPKPIIRPLNLHAILISILILVGSLTWLSTTAKSGLMYGYGMGFWGPNGHDGIWHLSLISELSRNIPPENPIFAGEKLLNYHYLFDLLPAIGVNLLNINPQDMLFRFFPALITLLSGLLMFALAKKVFEKANPGKNPFWAGFIATFFLYFGGSFGWVISYFRDRSFGGETMFWSQQSISTLLNPPFAISIMIFLAGAYLYYDLMEDQKWNLPKILILALLWGSLIGFKAYGGVLVLTTLAAVTIGRIIFNRNFQLLPILVASATLSAVIFLPSNSDSGSIFVLSPLWFVSTMIIFQDRLYWPRLYLTLESGVFYKVWGGLLFGTLIFLLGNFGTRLIGLFNFKAFMKNSFLFWMFVLGIIIPLLFIQKGTNWNSIQFFYYSLLILSIFASISFGHFLEKFRKIKWIGLILLVLLTIPTTLDTLNHYLPNRPPAMLSKSEFEALNFLKEQETGVVLSLPFNEKLKERFEAPVPLAYYAPTAYVSSFSQKPSFIEDTINLEILDVDYKGRVNLQKDFFKIPDQAKKILQNNNIRYIYLLKGQQISLDENKIAAKKIFENEEVVIYESL